MAQEKSPNEKPRQPRKPKVMNDAPLVEQITELMMICLLYTSRCV